MRALICLNPDAGGGRAERRLRRALASTGASALRVSVVEVRSLDDVCAALDTLSDDTTPVAAGGDGTVTLLATALRHVGLTDTPIGLLPLGTGNILAYELGITGVGDGLASLTSSHTRAVDAMATSHPLAPLALVSISAGFEAEFIARYARFRGVGRPLGVLAGLAAGTRSARGILAELDGAEVVSPDEAVFSAGLYNTAHYAARLAMSPQAEIGDGLGDCAVYRGAAGYWSTVARALLGRPPGPHDALRRRWRSARLETSGPLQVDGERVEGGAITVSLEPGALTVRVPEPRPR